MKKYKTIRKKRLDCLAKRVYCKRVNNEKPDRLQALIANCDFEIAAKKRELRELEAKRAYLEEAGREYGRLKNPALPDDYSDLGQTEAILAAIQRLCKKPSNAGGVQPYQIKNELLAKGFRSTAQFHTSVSVTLKRLTDSKRVFMKEAGRKRFYRPI